MILYRPVGLKELELIYDNNFKSFPPRLEGQPYFYPVTNEEYAIQIAKDWNTSDENSGYSGFVTSFEVNDSCIVNYETHVVGTEKHEEYWIPADDLLNFNNNIGRISILSAYYGEKYLGYNSQKFMLGNKSVIQQFMQLHIIREYSSFDFLGEIKANSKIFYFNYPFWIIYDFINEGINTDIRDKIISDIKIIWNKKIVDKPLIENSFLIKSINDEKLHS